VQLCVGAGGPDEIREILKALRISNELRSQVTYLVVNRKVLLESLPLSRGRLKKWLAEPLFGLLMQQVRCYLKAAGRGRQPLRGLQHQIAELGDEPISPARLLDGHELISLGAEPSPTVGHLAEELYLAQLENEVKTRAQAVKWVRNWLESHRNDVGACE